MAHQSSVNPTKLTRPGQDNATGSARALYLKLFSGEMFKGFQRNTIARDLVTKRTLKNGKSLQFIYTGRTTAEYHTPGNSILGNTDGAPPVSEKTITCDDLLVSSAFVYELDETLAHYDLRGEISKKIGYALAEKYDRLIFRSITQGARKVSPITKTNFKEPGGTQVRVGAAGSPAQSEAFNADNLIAAFYDAAAALDEKGISSDGRVGVLNPRQYYELIQKVGDGGLVNRDVQGGSLQSGQGVVEIAGIKIFKSMNIPFFDYYGVKYGISGGPADPGRTGDFVNPQIESAKTGDTGIAASGEGNSGYGQGLQKSDGTATGGDGNFNHSCGLIFQKEGAGVVEAIGPQVQVTSGDVSVIYQGDVILGRLAMGADYLNPAASVELYAGNATGNSAW